MPISKIRKPHLPIGLNISNTLYRADVPSASWKNRLDLVYRALYRLDLVSKTTSIFERPPGVPIQKIQFGNERGGRSVLSRLPELRIARILALLRCLILRPSHGNLSTRKKICLLGNNHQKKEFLLAS